MRIVITILGRMGLLARLVSVVALGWGVVAMAAATRRLRWSSSLRSRLGQQRMQWVRHNKLPTTATTILPHCPLSATMTTTMKKKKRTRTTPPSSASPSGRSSTATAVDVLRRTPPKFYYPTSPLRSHAPSNPKSSIEGYATSTASCAMPTPSIWTVSFAVRTGVAMSASRRYDSARRGSTLSTRIRYIIGVRTRIARARGMLGQRRITSVEGRRDRRPCIIIVATAMQAVVGAILAG
mmetsp:Transcript_11373/g.20955  ORF Transcript_11373/g.20955 Transcript_11373/m.20955 type:complete len:238 (+) Transcript_11373:1450-2163(+)